MSETHHHHHHDYAAANAKHFSEQAQTYRSELSVQLAKHGAGAILQNYPFDANQTEVLDFACGPGLVGLELLPHVKRLVGADSAQGMVDVFNQYADQQKIPKEKFHCVHIDRLKGDQTDLDGQLFDVIICVAAYHHFEDPAEMTRALVQRLKPKGRLMVIDFVDDEGLETIFGQGRSHSHGHIVAHKRGFKSEQMTEMFKASGLQQVQVDDAYQMSKSEMKKYQGHEIFGQAMQSDVDFTLKVFIAHGDKT